MAAVSPERAEAISSASPATPLSSCVLADTNGSRRVLVRRHSLPYAAFPHNQGELRRVKSRRVASHPTGVGLSSGVTTNSGSNNAAQPALSGAVPTDALPATLRERWRDESVGSVWLRPSDWYHPAVDALATALLSTGDTVGAATELGHARGYDGVGIGETL